MTNKDFITLYKLSKVGLCDSLTKKCLCDKEVGLDIGICPNCGTKLPTSKLLNVNKSTALGKRIETIDGSTCSFRVYELYSKGLELYETLFLDFTINTKTLEVNISNTKAFKNIEKYEDFSPFMEKNLPGFISYVYNCLSLVGGTFISSTFGGLSSDYISNILNVYINYSAIKDFLVESKVLYFGGKINLKDYLDIDYNSEAEVKKSGLLVSLLKTWDIKNLAYFNTIVEISKGSNDVIKTQLCDIADSLYEKFKRLPKYSLVEELNSYFAIFSLLYNKEISVEDFIRLYNTSSQEYFEQISDYKTLYKKHISKSVDWSSIKRLTEKNIGTLLTKEVLRKSKISKKDIDKIYSELEKNPLKALELLVEEE